MAYGTPGAIAIHHASGQPGQMCCPDVSPQSGPLLNLVTLHGVVQVHVVKAGLTNQDAQQICHTEASAEEEWLLPARLSSQDQST